MKAVVQRVKHTRLSVDSRLVSEISFGLAVYLGVESGDDEKQADYLAKKIANLRIFEDNNGKMNLSVLDTCGEVLLISQFTLCADTSQGNRPSFINAEKPPRAKELFDYAASKLSDNGAKVKTGVFGADMQIEQFNDGPVTIIIEN